MNEKTNYCELKISVLDTWLPYMCDVAVFVLRVRCTALQGTHGLGRREREGGSEEREKGEGGRGMVLCYLF